MDEMQSCLDVLRDNDVDVDNAVDRLMGNDNLYLEFIKRLPEELHLATLREALAQRDGFALVPLSVYFKNARVKIEVGLCKGKKNYDKRDSAAKRDAKREIDRAMKSRGQ